MFVVVVKVYVLGVHYLVVPIKLLHVVKEVLLTHLFQKVGALVFRGDSTFLSSTHNIRPRNTIDYIHMIQVIMLTVHST